MGERSKEIDKQGEQLTDDPGDKSKKKEGKGHRKKWGEGLCEKKMARLLSIKPGKILKLHIGIPFALVLSGFWNKSLSEPLRSDNLDHRSVIGSNLGL